MPRNPDPRSDRAAIGATLAAEAALLEAHERLLREALDAVDARIEAASAALRHLRRSAASAEAQKRADPGDGLRHGVADSDDVCLTWLDGSTTCRP
ncbi:hypothetical protein [Streptomyces canus]|uniref:hypothetical protein n=1 Tax=Streptomyces canus TaxID=58343 RepID=UPI002787BD39|nr:hypothetical protein [Streptomyces canus]MDQ0760325.1 hypothetical protein [Streptomyces canus]